MIDDEREVDEVNSLIQAELNWDDKVVSKEERVEVTKPPQQVYLTPRQQAQADIERKKRKRNAEETVNLLMQVNSRNNVDIQSLREEISKVKEDLEKEKQISKMWEERAYDMRNKLRDKEREYTSIQTELDKKVRSQDIALRVLGMNNSPTTTSEKMPSYMQAPKPEASSPPTSASDISGASSPFISYRQVHKRRPGPKTLKSKGGYPIRYDESEACANCFEEEHQWQGCPRSTLRPNFRRVCRRQQVTTLKCSERHRRDRLREAEEKERNFIEKKKRQMNLS